MCLGCRKRQPAISNDCKRTCWKHQWCEIQSSQSTLRKHNDFNSWWRSLQDLGFKVGKNWRKLRLYPNLQGSRRKSMCWAIQPHQWVSLRSGWRRQRQHLSLGHSHAIKLPSWVRFPQQPSHHAWMVSSQRVPLSLRCRRPQGLHLGLVTPRHRARSLWLRRWSSRAYLPPRLPLKSAGRYTMVSWQQSSLQHGHSLSWDQHAALGMAAKQERVHWEGDWQLASGW